MGLIADCFEIHRKVNAIHHLGRGNESSRIWLNLKYGTSC
ncbi:hypothetical protein C943_00757 [Mariniradius saccharolyticus AK6]|uniref:Uncharacterized protein n=1 Tax=Mariniradius saccharolyticus AK6 TaxID=1239962 RepID=M7XW89_9BACT|nr:hypothetical protein C943_00757 [Mariniradius saccharolyticus AK6]